jgi:pSer/pThr/pTyr-binding forkhead associated (FHA) protein
MPDVDLTPFAGYRMGVSRKHAVIRQNDETNERLDLWDMGSSNGTFLNGTRLNANRPYRLRDGDEIRFGQMIMRVYFQHTPTEGLPNPPAGSSSPSPSQSNGTSPLQPPKP